MLQISSRRILQFYSNLKLKFDDDQQTAFLTLTNPLKRNPLSLETIRELQSSLIEIQSQIQKRNLKMLVMRGEGKVFSAGHDLKQLKDTSTPEQIFNQCNKMMIFLKKFPLITLCAVDNMATAAGLQLVLTSDMIIATKQATFGIPGMKRGLFPSTPLVQLQRTLKSQCLTRQIVLYGEILTAQEADNCGLVNKIVEQGKLDEDVEKYIEKSKKLSREVIIQGKWVLNAQASLSLEKAYTTW